MHSSHRYIHMHIKLVSLMFIAVAALYAEEPKPTPTAEQLQKELAASKAETDKWKEYAGELGAFSDKQSAALLAAYQSCLGPMPQKPAALATPVQPQSSVAEQTKESDAKK